MPITTTSGHESGVREAPLNFFRALRGSSHQAETGAQLADECFGLLEGGEMSALRQLVEVCQLGEFFLGPSPGRAEYLFGENRAADRNRHRIRQCEAAKALPVQAGRRRR